MYRAALECRNGGFEETGFVYRIGMDGHLHVELIGDFQAASIAAGVVPQSS